MNYIEKKRLKLSLIIPVSLLIIMWGSKFYEYSLNLSFSGYGIYPRNIGGLKGIIFSPFIHGSFKHLISNSLPFLILGTSLFYFYGKHSLKVLFLIWILSGTSVWFTGRESYHIGASGMIYGFASFIFFSGLFHKNKSLLSISLLVVFLYGGMVWGLLPLKPEISWESHLSGAVSGLILSLFFSPRIIKDKKETKIETGILYEYDTFFDNEYEIKYHLKEREEKDI